MPTFGPQHARCHVFTQKEGFLSAMAHDLEIAVTDFTIDAEDSAIKVRCNSNSLRVLHALKEGKPFETLSDKDKGEIQGNIVNDVLNAKKFPEITFESSSITRNPDGGQVSGTLTLHGVSKPVQANVRVENGSYIAEIPIHQPEFGIKPYTAMLGTLKVKPDLLVRVSIPKW